MFIVFIGPPGVGKGTQSKRVARHLNVPHLSTGEMLRETCSLDSELGRQVNQFLASGRLVSDNLVNEIVDRRVGQSDCNGGCLFDGFPRTLVQARSLDEILARHHHRVELVIELRADEEELVRRMLHRSQIEHRPDDSPDTIRNRLLVYRTQTAPLLGYYQRQGLLETIDGVGSPDEIFQRICMCLPKQNT